MPHYSSQQPFLFAALPSATSLLTMPNQSFGSVNSSAISIRSSLASIAPNRNNNSSSFYNLSKDSNKSNIDLSRSHHSYPCLSSNISFSNLNLNQFNTSGHSFYTSGSCASSSLSLVPSQLSADKVNHAFGSLPPPYPGSSFSASSSSLPLAAYVNTPITTPATATTKTLSSSSSSLASRHRSHQPPRKRIPNAISPLNTKALPKASSLSPSYISSQSSMMSSTSPAGGNTFSEVSSASGSAPPTPAYLRPFTSMSITELVISEAHYLTTIDRVANALTQAADKAAATGRKESMAVHALTERWFEIIRMHSKFHDDIVAVGEDLRETAALMNGLLVTLEPILIDHGRDLSVSLKKLIRRDQNSEHSFAEWDSALRQPFEHLSTYAEWLLRIDPQSKFCKDYRSHLNGLIYKIRMVTEANQHPRNMLQRLSTMARGVIKRRSSVHFLTHSSTSNPGTPNTPRTPISAASNISNGTSMTDKLEIHAMSSMSNISTDSLPMAQTVRSLEIATNCYMDDATTDLTSPRDRKYGQMYEKDLPATPSAGSDADEPNTPIADTFLSATSSKQLQHCASTASDVSCMGTLTSVAPSPSTSSLSSSSVYSKSEPLQPTSLTRGKFLSDMDARKATLRVGASQTIQAKAESLQSPAFKLRSLNNNVRKVSATKKDANNKPPVKSLISFWEQVSDPLDA